MAEPLAAMSTTELLHYCKGRPVRLSLFDAVYHDRLGRYPGLLAEVLPDSIRIECLDTPVTAPPDTAVTLELVRDGQLFWCHSRLLPWFEQRPHVLSLAWPDRLQTLQYRRTPRIDTYMPVHYTPDGGVTPTPGVIINISTGGAALHGACNVAPGQGVSLVFALGSGLFFQDIRAEVLRATRTRSGSWQMGLRFHALTADQERHLGEWIKSRWDDVHRTGN